jgi:iron complex outermembrane receptor protein
VAEKSSTLKHAIRCVFFSIAFGVLDDTAVANVLETTSTTLESVVVTARRREEDIRSVPIAMSVIDGDKLDATSTVNTQQLAELVPTMYFNSANPRNTAYTIRGLGSNTLSISAANDGIEPGVGFYVDEVYHGRPATASFDFTDIERIEVLRGPQGTVFGKNTTAGAIHVISRIPQFTPEMRAEVSWGNYDFAQAKATIGGAIANHLAGRVSVQFTRRGGVIHNIRTGEDLNSLDNRAARLQLLYAPTDNLKVRWIADVSDQDSSCCTQNFLRVGQSLRSASRQFPALAAGINYAPPSRNIYDRLTDIDSPLRIDTQQGGISAIVDWSLTPVTLTAISAWRYWDWDVANDRDFTGLPIQAAQRIPSRQDQYSQEIRVASYPDSHVQHVSGLFFFRQRITANPTSIYGPAAAYWLLNPANFNISIPSDLLDGYGQTGRSQFDMKSYATFGEITVDMTPRLAATLGLRYTHEEKSGSYATQTFGGNDLAEYSPTGAAELTRAKLSIFRPQSYEAQIGHGNLSGRANLIFRFDDQRFAFFGISHGYKSGGLNMSGLPLDATNQPALTTVVIRDEINRTIEAGLKSTWLGNRLRLDLAVFDTRIEDYQANIVSSVETAALRSYPANIPAVRVQGIEADLAFRASPRLTLRSSVAYAEGRYIRYPAGPCPLESQTAGTIACDLSGERLAGLSRWAASLGIDYRIPVDAGEWVFASDTSIRSSYNSDTAGSRYTVIDGYDATNVRIAFKASRRWQAELYATNVFSANYLTALTIQAGNSGLILGQPSDPRLIGVRFQIDRR